MRSAMTMQRMVVNQMVLEQGNFVYPNQWPTRRPARRRFSRARRAALRHHQWREAPAAGQEDGFAHPGKEADIIILDATAINVAPLNNVPGAVVSLMDRTNARR